MGKKRRQTKRKLTANQQEWEYQIKNLKRRIKALEKYAYIDFDIPERPERVTKKDIARIKGIRRKELLQYAYEADILTGEITQYVPPKPKRRARKAASEELEPLPYPTSSEPVAIEDKVLSEVEFLIANYAGNPKYPALTERTRAQLTSVLAERVEEVGRKAVSEALEREYNREGVVMAALSESKSNVAQELVNKFAKIVYGRALTQQEAADINVFAEGVESFELPQ